MESSHTENALVDAVHREERVERMEKVASASIHDHV